MSPKEFFTADEAAQWVGRESGESVQAADIHRLVESGTLPICFRFRGDLGVFDSPAACRDVAQSVMQAVFAPAKRKAYFPGGYLRAAGGGTLGVAIRDLRGRVTKTDLVKAGPVTIAQPGRGFGGLNFDPAAEVMWPLREGGQRAMGQSIDSAVWLFHTDDLAKLVPIRAKSAASGAESVPSSRSEFPMSKKALIAKREHVWPTVAADLADAARNGLQSAKAGGRGWNESMALAWARSKGKLKSDAIEGDHVGAAMRRMVDLPSRTYALGS